MILLSALSLGTPLLPDYLYPCRFIWQEKFWKHFLPFIGTNLQVSIFCLGFWVKRFWPTLTCLWKQEKMRKKTAFGKKRTCDAVVASPNFFASCLQRSLEVLVLIKLTIHTVQHCLIKFEFPDYSSFFNRRYFQVTSP